MARSGKIPCLGANGAFGAVLSGNTQLADLVALFGAEERRKVKSNLMPDPPPPIRVEWADRDHYGIRFVIPEHTGGGLGVLGTGQL
jgi:hypothetical protein